EFERYEFVEGRPKVDVEFRGDLRDLSSLTAKAHIEAPAFSKRGQAYQVESLAATVRFDGREKRAEIEELKIRDRVGALEFSGQWKQVGNRLDFAASSTVDLAGLAAAFWSDKKLGEIVF